MRKNITAYITIEKVEDIAKYKEFEKTIPFNISYGHLGYSQNQERLIASIHTTYSKCYKLIIEWLKANKIEYKEEIKAD